MPPLPLDRPTRVPCTSGAGGIRCPSTRSSRASALLRASTSTRASTARALYSASGLRQAALMFLVRPEVADPPPLPVRAWILVLGAMIAACVPSIFFCWGRRSAPSPRSRCAPSTRLPGRHSHPEVGEVVVVDGRRPWRRRRRDDDGGRGWRVEGAGGGSDPARDDEESWSPTTPNPRFPAAWEPAHEQCETA